MTTIELRFEWPVGQATFRLTQQQALKAAVLTRGLGLGLTLKDGQAMVTKKTASFPAAEAVLRRIRH